MLINTVKNVYRPRAERTRCHESMLQVAPTRWSSYGTNVGRIGSAQWSGDGRNNAGSIGPARWSCYRTIAVSEPIRVVYEVRIPPICVTLRQCRSNDDVGLGCKVVRLD